MKRIHSLLLLLSFFVAVYAQEMTVAERNAAQGFNDTIDRLSPDFVTVSLCIADPTDQRQDYLGVAGHAFLRMQCQTFGYDYCFSYESENLKGQVLDYIRGKLKMKMVCMPTDEYVEDYRTWDRAVHEYHINMPPEAELRLWEQMDNHMMSEQNMHMDIVRFGCTNTLVRYVENALRPDTISYTWPEKYYTQDAMDIVSEHFSNYPWTLLGIHLTASKDFARFRTPKQKIIFPDNLLEVWSLSSINGQPVLAYMGDIVEAEPVVVHKPWFTPQLCGILILLVLVGGICVMLIRKK